MLVIQADLLNSKFPQKLSWTVCLIKRFAISVIYSAREINNPGPFLNKLFWGSRIASDHTLPAWPKQLSYKSGQDKLQAILLHKCLHVQDENWNCLSSIKMRLSLSTNTCFANTVTVFYITGFPSGVYDSLFLYE